MSRFLVVVFIALLVAACAPTQTADTTGATSVGIPESGAPEIPPELVDHEIREVSVGDRVLTLAIADSPTLRAQGLMGVTDLGDLDGMLFYWRHDASGGFWMKDTLIPLDIVWFLEDGTYTGRASMEPCTTTECPTFTPGDGIDYRFGIEANPGDLDWIDESTVIVYTD